ncbi:MAG TPA: DedA family protein [Propionibacteriaceae bacterium]|nr:DedA family protein [Propionibacteriaceae bacterium]
MGTLLTSAVELMAFLLDISLRAVSDWAVRLMEELGGVGAGIAIALENVFPPVPSEVILPLAGFAASRGSITLVEALGWTTAGSVVGALALYGVGAALGQRRMRKVVGKIPLVKVEDIDHTQAWFKRHGGKAVFFGRMVPLFRSFISIPAGIERMSLVRFALLTLAGSALWNTIFVLAGFFLGENWQLVQRYGAIFQWIVVGVAVLAVGTFVVRRVRERRG